MAERIDLNLMQVFDALMRERSVSRAAERLGLGQPATSAALSRLRDLFGDELFVRGLTTMTPTIRATTAHPAIRSALDAITRAINPTDAFDPGSERRVFRLSGGDYAAMILLPRLYDMVRRTAPMVDLRFRFAEKDAVFGLLEKGELDVAIGVYPRAPKSFGRMPLMTDSFVCLIRRDHPDLADGLSLDLFCRLTHILATERGDESGVVDTALKSLGRTRRIALTVPHLLTVPVVVAASDSIATVGKRVADICREVFETIEVLAPPIELATWSLSQLWSRQRNGDKGLEWLRDLLQRAASDAASGQ